MRANPWGLWLLSIVPLTTLATAGVAQQAYPAPGAPYAAGVASPAGATIAVVGGLAGRGADVTAAARSALRDLESRLRDLGLGKQHLLRVRAALAPGNGAEFTAWNEAWTAFFAGGHVPARTTVGSSGLPGGAQIVLDAVAVFPTDAGDASDTRATLNPNIRLAGPAENPTAVVSTRSGLFLSSGVLPGRNLQNPTAMEDHMRSSMNSLTGTLAEHGLRWPDVFFVRVLPTPQPDRAAPDFAAWSPVYGTLGELTGGHAPAQTMWAAPGFSATSRFVEIEVWATPHAPAPVFGAIDLERQNPLLVMSGSPTSAIASGAMIAPNAELIWLSGVVAPEGTPPEQESAATLALMKERLAAMGASMVDVAELRVYRVSRGEEDDLADAWNDAYGAEFATDASPHKPVRTNYLVQSLPGGRHVEVEVLVVRQPKGF
jgi:enamine deaminase RidA (YjgF/YER057c/UK114 family)